MSKIQILRKYFFALIILSLNVVVVIISAMEGISLESKIALGIFIIIADILFYLLKKLSLSHEGNRLLLIKALESQTDSLNNNIESLNNNIESLSGQVYERVESIDAHLNKEVNLLYNRLEARMRINSILNNEKDWGSFSNWALYSDTAIEILKELPERNKVFEVGSGVSTIMISQYLKNQGFGKLISIDHDEKFFLRTKKQIEELNLTDYCDLYYCPLIEVTTSEGKFQWYDLNNINLSTNSIELLIVDGPPGAIQENSRYPALEILKDKLTPEALVLLDDGHRKEERYIAKLWEQKGYKKEFVNTSKGLFKLYRD